MKNSILLCLLILASALPARGQTESGDPPARPPVDEAAILDEIDRLVDETAPPSEKDHEAAVKFARKGIEAHDARDYERAIEWYDKALRRDPLNAAVYYEKALTYTTVGDQVKALDAITRALALDPKMSGAYVQKASILDDLGYPEAALECFDQLLALEPDNFMALLNKGVTYFRLGRMAEAEAAFQKARAVDTGHPSPYFHLAQIAAARDHGYEEVEYLEKFLAVGQEDRRREYVEKRLKELNTYEVVVDPEAPYPTIELTEKLARANWRTEKHRETFPEAKGYFPSLEEEKAVYQKMVLPMWRAEKEKDPAAAHPFYDLLLAVDEAGFFEEFVYHTRGGTMGETGKDWLSNNSDRIERFLAWAKENGFVEEPGAPAEDPSAIDIRRFLQDVVEITNTSELVYNIQSEVMDEEIESFSKAEAELFRDDLDISGDDELACKAFDEDLYGMPAELRSKDSLVHLLRCHRPVGEDWERLSQLSSRIRVRLEDLSYSPRASVRRRGGEIDVKAENLPWSLYALAKAAWKNEPELRRRHGGPEEYRPTVLEEVLAVGCAVQAYVDSRQGGEGEDSTPEDPTFEVLLRVSSGGQLPGYVIFEILGRIRGVDLSSLSPDHARLVEAYLKNFVLN